MLLIGVCITLAGIAIIGYAGSLRSKNMTEEERKAAVKDFALTKGLLVALLAGVMSACFALGLEAGTPIKEAAISAGVEGLYAGLPVIFLVTFGGFMTNAAYCLQQNIKNKTGKDPMYAIMPEVVISGPKLSRDYNTNWYASRVNGRYETCMHRAKRLKI